MSLQVLDKVRYNGRTYVITMAAEDNPFGLLGLMPLVGNEQTYAYPEEVVEIWNDERS